MQEGQTKRVLVPSHKLTDTSNSAIPKLSTHATAIALMTTKKTTTDMSAIARDYKYTQEISQMVGINPQTRCTKHLRGTTQQMFVFGEVQDPTPETVNLVEDIVHSQIIKLVCTYFHYSTGHGPQF